MRRRKDPVVVGSMVGEITSRILGPSESQLSATPTPRPSITPSTSSHPRSFARPLPGTPASYAAVGSAGDARPSLGGGGAFIGGNTGPGGNCPAFSVGTTGTIVGTARYLHERSPRVRVVAVEPDHEMHGLEGLKHLPSAIVPEVYDPHAHDEKVTASTENSYATCAEVLETHGLLVGHSAGAALWAAREVARSITSGVIVALLPDGGERYLSKGRG